MATAKEEYERHRQKVLTALPRLPLARRISLLRLEAKKRGLYLPLPYGLPNSDEQDLDCLPVLERAATSTASNDVKYRSGTFVYSRKTITTVVVID
jgi:hypothetical protein